MKTLAQVTILMFTTLMFSSCTNGWSIGNLNIDPNDSSFVAIVDQDSTSHYYDANISLDKDCWCYTHNQWEVIRTK